MCQEDKNTMKRLKITVNGIAYDVQVEEVTGSAPAAVSVPSAAAAPAAAPAQEPVSAPAAAPAASAQITGEAINAPMPGTIVTVNVTVGQSIKKGEALVILEAMKMENEIMAPHDGTVAGIYVNKGDSVNSGTPLVSLR